MKFVFVDVGLHFSTNPDGLMRYSNKLLEAFDQSGRSKHQYIFRQIVRQGGSYYLIEGSDIDENSISLESIAKPGDYVLMPSLDTAFVEAFDSICRLKKSGIRFGSLIPDLIAVNNPEFFPSGVSGELKSYFANLSLISDFVVVPSEIVRKNLIDFQIDMGLNFPPIHIGFPGNDHFQQVTTSSKKEKKILYVSTIEPRKQHIRLISAYLNTNLPNLGWKLSLVGKMGWLTPRERLTFVGLCRSSSIEYFSDASDEELLEQYKSCSGVVMVSADEGYGLSLLEAGMNEIPLFCSDTPIFREVTCGFAFFTSRNLDDLETDLQTWVSRIENDEAEMMPLDLIQVRTWDNLAKVWIQAIEQLDSVWTK